MEALVDQLIFIPAFIFSLGVIVFVHESGHFLVARLFGVRVLVFSLGFGKAIWGFHHGGTSYRIARIPLGGYVRMGGEMPEDRTGAPDDFLSKPRWQRILIYLAGPSMNVALSIGLIAGVFMQGIEMQAIEEIPAVVGLVEDNSPAAAAGLEKGDRILRINGDAVSLWKDVSFTFATSAEREVTVEILRGDRRLELLVTPAKDPRYQFGDAGVFPELQLRTSIVLGGTPAERAGFRSGDEVRKVDGREVTSPQDFVDYINQRPGVEIEVGILRRGEPLTLKVTPMDVEGKGLIGVRLGSFRQLPLGEALVASVHFNIEIVEKSAEILGKLFTRKIAPQSAISGPIEIAALSGRAARRGFKDLLYTMGFLSISIGFMNLLPIPVLDGGHISILVVESLLRRDLSLKVKERITQVGFMMLMTLMALVIIFDLSKNLPYLFS